MNMEINQSLKVTGSVRAVVRDEKGNIVRDTGFSPNIITILGLAAISGLVGNTGAQTAFTYLAVGTDPGVSTPIAIGNTTLGAELTTLGLGRSAATVSRVNSSQTNDTLQLTFTWSATGTATVGEIGIFNAVSSGVMLGRKVLSPTLAVQNGYSLALTYKIQFS